MPLYSEQFCILYHGLAILCSVYHSLLFPIIIHLLCVGACIVQYIPAHTYHALSYSPYMYFVVAYYPSPILKICHHTIPWSQHQPLVAMVMFPAIFTVQCLMMGRSANKTCSATRPSFIPLLSSQNDKK